MKKMILTVIGVVVMACVIFMGHFYYATHTAAGAGFQELEPKVLPPGVKITDRTMEVWSSKTDPFTYNKLLRLRLNSPYAAISEDKYNPNAYKCDTQVVNQTCEHLQTPKHQPYTMITTYMSNSDKTGEIFSQTVSLLKGNTFIWIDTSGLQKPMYSKEVWDSVIDSFAPVRYSHLAVKHYAPGP